MGHLEDLPAFESDPQVDVRGDPRFSDESREPAGLDGSGEVRDAVRGQDSRAVTRASEESAQEVPAGAEDLVTWDVSPDDAGHLVEETETEDEAEVPAAMAEQGRDDADRDLRRANHADTD